MIPGSARMVVYPGRVLTQMRAHSAARYRATWPYHQHLLEGPAPARAHRKPTARVRNGGERLAEMETIMPPLFTHDCLRSPGGRLVRALEVQNTQAPISLRTGVDT